MATQFTMQDNTASVLEALAGAVKKGLMAIGAAAEEHAKDEVKHATMGIPSSARAGPELRNSIGYRVEGNIMQLGTNMELAAYAELGTGKEYQPPVDWIGNDTKKGEKVPAGLDHWLYLDPLEKVVKVGAPQTPQPFLRPAMEENGEEYGEIMEWALKNC